MCEYQDILAAIARKLIETDKEKGIDISNIEAIASSEINFGIYTTIDYMFKLAFLEKMDKIIERLGNIK